MKVSVYFNLHKKCWSIRSRGRVIAHAARVEISSPEFKVSASGRARVLRENKKNVHAFVSGELVSFGEANGEGLSGDRVTYNPYKFSTFVRAENEEAIFNAEYAVLEDKKVYARCS